MNGMKSNKQICDALKMAVERWREADWHWTLEFGEVCGRWQDHIPQNRDDGEEFKRMLALIDSI